MAIDLAGLTEPVSEEEVCGPDLEMIGDPDYMRFSARIEGILPKSFAEFDRGSIEFEKEFATIDTLLENCRDLRLLVFRAKLSVLNRDLQGFVSALAACEALTEKRWDAVYPQLLDGDPILRVIALQTLDDMPDTVMPLQQMPLFKTRRSGSITYRAYLLSEDQVAPRKNEDGEDEKKPSASDIRSAITDAELADLVQVRDVAVQLLDTLNRIETLVEDLSGQPVALRFSVLKPLVDGMAKFLDQAVGIRDPSLALKKARVEDDDGPSGDSGGSEGSAPAGEVYSHASANRALKVASAYFQANEPSSLTRPLLLQAIALIGKSFYDAMQIIVPEHASYAKTSITREIPLNLQIERLAYLPGMEEDPSRPWDQPEPEHEPEQEVEPEPAPVSVPEPEPEPQVEMAQESEGAEGSEGESVSGEEAPAEEASVPVEEPPAPPPAPAPAPPKPKPARVLRGVYRANTRQEALALLDQVSGYFRIAEPSSPIPVLLDHARSMGGRDFLALLRDVLPKSALRVDE